MKRPAKRISWSSRASLFIVAIGAPIGLSNVWLFPNVLAENGGAAFLYSYVFCLALLAFPLMLAEFIVGRYARCNPIQGVARIAQEQNLSKMWAILGVIQVVTGLLFFAYLSVVASWTLFYLMKSISGSFITMPAEFIQHQYSALLQNTDQMLIWLSVFILMVVFIVSRGLIRGVEHALWVLIPCFFVGLICLVMYIVGFGYSAKLLLKLSHYLPNFLSQWLVSLANFLNESSNNYIGFSNISRAGRFVFILSNQTFDPKVIVSAFSQALLTLGVGFGVMMTYGSYIRSNRPVMAVSGLVLLANVAIALIMALIVLCIAFAFNLEPKSGDGLLFVGLPVAFSKMANGNNWSILFFTSMLIAALISAIALLEPSVAWLNQRWRIKRKTSAWLMGLLVWMIGVVLVYSFTDLRFDFYFLGHLFKYGLFDLIFVVCCYVLVPIAVLLLAFFAAWSINKQELMRSVFSFSFAYRLWLVSVRIAIPILVAIVIAIVLLNQIKTL